MSTIDVETTFNVLRVVFGCTFLFYASFTDLKERRVKDIVWLIMGFTGGIFILLQMFLEKRAWEYYLIFIPVTILFASMFFEFKPLYDKKKKVFNGKVILLFIIGIAALLYQFNALSDDTYFYRLLTIPILILVFYIFYQANILHGGADAKALMTLAIFTPFYPRFLDFPIVNIGTERVSDAVELMFPFAILVLMNGVIFVIWIFLAFFIFNATKKDVRMPEMLLGYKMDIEEAEKTFVWPMEKIVDGKRVRVLFPKKLEEDALAKLKEHGAKRIWVTPKMPFIVALTGGFIISVFFGNVFWALLSLIG
jgi:preflagellin peptidase FlaK